MSDKNSGKEGTGAHKEVHKKTHQNQGYKEPKGHRQQKESGIAGVPILDCPNEITWIPNGTLSLSRKAWPST